MGSTGTATSPIGYAGAYTDAAAGLQYDHARYYDPATGQFISKDPLEEETEQPYSYADDNPITNTDPTGLCSVFRITCDANAVGNAIGTAASDVGNAVATGASWVWNHPLEAGGIVLGAISVVTGVGAAVDFSFAIGDLTIEASGFATASAATGVGANVADARECAKGDTAACIGAALGLPGSVIGVGQLVPESVLSDALATILDSAIADRAALTSGTLAFLWDLESLLNGLKSRPCFGIAAT